MGAVNLSAQAQYSVTPSEIRHSSQVDKRLPNTQMEWKTEALPPKQKQLQTVDEAVLILSEQTPIPFTGLAVGWKAGGTISTPDHFKLEIRSRLSGEEWPDWVTVSGYLAPDDSPSGLFWAMLYVTSDGEADDEFEIRINSPTNSAITYLKVTAADARYEIDSSKQKESKIDSGDTDMPEIIGRDGWWGNLPAGELNPDYTPQQIDISHAVVHHTVTANEPPDPGQVVRQIWDWHVNDNGWLDIGYNFLIDHLGNIYAGRYNPWLEITDIRGAHAGSANSKSVGIALMGQFEPGAVPQFGSPEAEALNSLVQIISWRFSQKEIDPLGSDFISVNSGGMQNLPAIIGHRDVSATACPGENLYTLLFDIRREVETGQPDEPEEIVTGPFELYQNYPNPFNSQTTIPFTLEEDRQVSLDLYTINGQRIRRIYSAQLNEGSYEVPFHASGLSSGTYFYELVTDDYRRMRQMIFIK
jgi:hypothetical protein